MASSIGKNQGMWVPEEFVCQAITDPSANEASNGEKAEENGRVGSEAIVFPDAYYRVFERNSFAFPAQYRGREIRCVISCETLVHRFAAKAANLKDSEPTFLKSRAQLHDLAKTLIRKSKPPESEIVIN